MGLIIVKKGSLETTIGAIEQHRLSVSVKVGSHPGTRFLLKPGEEKRDCFMEGKERNTHTHTPSVPPLLFLFTYMNFRRCLAREKDRNMHAFFRPQALYLSDIIYVSYLSFYLESLQYTHTCS